MKESQLLNISIGLLMTASLSLTKLLQMCYIEQAVEPEYSE